MASKDDRELRRQQQAGVFLMFPPPSWVVHAIEPSGPTSSNNSSHRDLSQVSGETRSRLSRTAPFPVAGSLLPILNAQSPPTCHSAPSLAVCTVCIALRKEGTAGVSQRVERGQARRHPPSPSPASLSSLPSKRGRGVMSAWEAVLPLRPHPA